MGIETDLDKINSFQGMVNFFGVNEEGESIKAKAYVGFFGWKRVSVQGYWFDTRVTILLIRMMDMVNREKNSYSSEERIALRKVERFLEKMDHALDEKKIEANFITRIFIWIFNPDQLHEKACSMCRVIEWQDLRGTSKNFLADFYTKKDYQKTYGEEPTKENKWSTSFNGHRVYIHPAVLIKA